LDPARRQHESLDDVLSRELARAGFTGRIEESLESRLGRPIDTRLVDVGRLIFFDQLNGIYEDNSCAGCHAPMNGFGDTQSIAIGVGNNGVVGPHRRGARNQRKAPLVINSGFYPKLMLNGRFQSCGAWIRWWRIPSRSHRVTSMPWWHSYAMACSTHERFPRTSADSYRPWCRAEYRWRGSKAASSGGYSSGSSPSVSASSVTLRHHGVPAGLGTARIPDVGASPTAAKSPA